MEDDWDLHAVVRGCCTSAVVSAATGPSSSASTTTITDPLHFHLPYPLPPLGSSDLLEQRTSSFEEELHELCKPFFPKPDEPLLFQSHAAVSASRGSKDPSLLNQPLLQHPKQSSVATQSPRSKKRKNQFKKVCQVPAESISSDIWAWRKYGQKPIKGSPYPRGYYRCSSSKGCLARKQVERNRSDPGLFIVTYTAEHNHRAPTHRNTLAGSTRPLKPATTTLAANSLEAEGETMPRTQSTSRGGDNEDNDEEDQDDDFFVGLEDLLDGDSSNEDGRFLDRFPANFGLSWNPGSAAAAAGGS